MYAATRNGERPRPAWIPPIESSSPTGGRAVVPRRMDRMTLAEARQSLGLTQREIAARLGSRQDTVSRIERREGIKLSTLRAYAQALGGRLVILIELPDRPPVEVIGQHEDG